MSKISLSDLDFLRRNPRIAAIAIRPRNPPAIAIYNGVLTIAGACSMTNDKHVPFFLKNSFLEHIDFLVSETCTQDPEPETAFLSFNGHHKQ